MKKYTKRTSTYLRAFIVILICMGIAFIKIKTMNELIFLSIDFSAPIWGKAFMGGITGLVFTIIIILIERRLNKKFKNMEKMKLPKNVRLFYVLSGLIIAFLIGLFSNDLDVDEDILTGFLVSSVIYIPFMLLIGKRSYRGYLLLKEWIKKVYIVGSIVFSFLIALIISELDLESEDFFILFSCGLIGFFFLGLLSLWVYDSYKNNK